MFESSPLATAKARLPIPVLWQLLNLPGNPGRECFCPFHDNRNSKAASVFERGGETFFNCFGGCVDKAVDSAGFLALHLGASNEEACRKLIEMAGVLPSVPQIPRQEKRETEAEEKTRKRAFWPALEVPTKAELRAVADLRGLSVEGVQLAVNRGLLWSCDTRGARAWAVTDSARVNARVRRLDGGKWYGDHKTLPPEPGGTVNNWPVGVRESVPFQAVVLVEGEADALAAHHLLWIYGLEDFIAVVGMLGAGSDISTEALPMFAGKRVRIFPHNDPEEKKEVGQTAAAGWASQLAGAGADADGFSFEGFVTSGGKPVKDLNDFCHLDVDAWESNRTLVETAFDIAHKCPTKASPCESGVTVSETEGRAA